MKHTYKIALLSLLTFSINFLQAGTSRLSNLRTSFTKAFTGLRLAGTRALSQGVATPRLVQQPTAVTVPLADTVLPQFRMFTTQPVVVASQKTSHWSVAGILTALGLGSVVTAVQCENNEKITKERSIGKLYDPSSLNITMICDEINLFPLSLNATKVIHNGDVWEDAIQLEFPTAKAFYKFLKSIENGDYCDKPELMKDLELVRSIVLEEVERLNKARNSFFPKFVGYGDRYFFAENAADVKRNNDWNMSHAYSCFEMNSRPSSANREKRKQEMQLFLSGYLEGAVERYLASERLKARYLAKKNRAEEVAVLPAAYCSKTKTIPVYGLGTISYNELLFFPVQVKVTASDDKDFDFMTKERLNDLLAYGKSYADMNHPESNYQDSCTRAYEIAKKVEELYVTWKHK